MKEEKRFFLVKKLISKKRPLFIGSVGNNLKSINIMNWKRIY